MNKIFAAALLIAFTALGGCKEASISDEIAKQEKVDEAENAKVSAANEAYLAANKAKPGVIVTQSGLQYRVVRKGNAAAPTPSPQDEVTVMYEGALTNGIIFDSSYQRNEPATFQVGGVIPAWTEALMLMHPGDAFELVVPPEIGYAQEDKGKIPPNSILLFKVELLSYVTPAGKVVTAK